VDFVKDQDSGTDLISLLILLLFFLFLLGRPLQNRLRLRRFKSDRDEIWQYFSSSKYASTDGVDFWFDITLSWWRPRRHFAQQSAATWGLALCI